MGLIFRSHCVNCIFRFVANIHKQSDCFTPYSGSKIHIIHFTSSCKPKAKKWSLFFKILFLINYEMWFLILSDFFSILLFFLFSFFYIRRGRGLGNFQQVIKRAYSINFNKRYIIPACNDSPLSTTNLPILLSQQVCKGMRCT